MRWVSNTNVDHPKLLRYSLRSCCDLDLELRPGTAKYKSGPRIKLADSFILPKRSGGHPTERDTLVARLIAGELVKTTHASGAWLKRGFGRELRRETK